MTNVFGKIKDLFTNYDDEDYVSNLIVEDDEYEEYLNEKNNDDEDLDEAVYSMRTFTENISTRNTAKRDKQEVKSMRNAEEPRLVNFKDVNTNKVVIIKPRSLEDGQTVANQLKAGRITVVNFEETDGRLAQRVIDFLTGSAFSLGGTVSPISDLIFMVSPLNITVSDNLDTNVYDEDRDYSNLRNLVSGL